MEKDDIGMVCQVMAGAVAGLPAEKETPPFWSFQNHTGQEEKTGAPHVILTSSLWTLLYMSRCLS